MFVNITSFDISSLLCHNTALLQKETVHGEWHRPRLGLYHYSSAAFLYLVDYRQLRPIGDVLFLHRCKHSLVHALLHLHSLPASR